MNKLLSVLGVLLVLNVLGCSQATRDPAAGLISFHLVVDKDSPDSFSMKTADGKEELYLASSAQITVQDIDSAKLEPIAWPQGAIDAFERKGLTPPPYKILIKCTPQGRDKLLNVTSENLGRRLAMVIGGKLLMAPKMLEPIPGGEVAVQGNIPAKEAQQFVEEINRRKRRGAVSR